MAKNYDFVLLLDFYGDLLTRQRRDFLEYYYNDDLSLSEIAENENTTRQCVYDTLKQGERKLAEYEAKLGLAARFRQISEKAAQIAALTDPLTRHADAEVSAAALQIRQTAEELKSLG